MQKARLKTKGGYTIIETMIAVALFLIITTAGMGALLSANSLHQKSRDMRSILDNLSFIMEDISRNLRTGSNYYCITAGDTLSDVSSTTKGGSSCWGIAFEPAGGSTSNPNDQWVYYIDNSGNIFKSVAGPYNTINNFVQLNPDPLSPGGVFIRGNESTVQVSGFSILGPGSPGASPNDFQQPFVTIRLVGKINYKGVDTTFSIQTSVSQRAVDI